jgi:hypothetical protein
MHRARARQLLFWLITASLPLGSCKMTGGGAQPVTTPADPGTPTPAPAPAPTPAPAPIPAPMSASDWEIGPIIGGKDYSRNFQVTPAQDADGGWHIGIPQSDGVHYVTRHFGSAGKTMITIHYRVEMADGVKIVPSTEPDGPSMGPVFYFQRKGDNWNSDGWRWWATFDVPHPIVAGKFELSVPLDGAWTSVETETAANSPGDFYQAKQYAERVGFTLGGGTGYGHGVYATGQARIAVTDFRVE